MMFEGAAHAVPSLFSGHSGCELRANEVLEARW